MNDYINRQAAIDALGERPMSWTDSDYELGSVNRYDIDRLAIDTVPSADVAPVRHGRWIPKFNGAFRGGAYWYDCSECGHTVTGGNLSGKHFCENCGARMDGDADD